MLKELARQASELESLGIELEHRMQSTCGDGANWPTKDHEEDHAKSHEKARTSQSLFPSGNVESSWIAEKHAGASGR